MKHSHIKWSIIGFLFAIALILLTCAAMPKKRSKPVLHGATTLMLLAKQPPKSFAQPPANLGRLVRFEMPTDYMEYYSIKKGTNIYYYAPLWSVERSRDMISWTMVASNMTGIQSTNSDIFATNTLPMEVYRMRRQDRFYK